MNCGVIFVLVMHLNQARRSNHLQWQQVWIQEQSKGMKPMCVEVICMWETGISDVILLQDMEQRQLRIL
ncbi:Uncharacterised protein [Dorea longicatena]|nr:Uncharacterised protein [Dorea longicatena]